MGIVSIIIGILSSILGVIVLLIFRSLTSINDDALIVATFVSFERIALMAPILPMVGLLIGISDLVLRHIRKKPKMQPLVGLATNLLALFLFYLMISFR